MHKKNHNVQNKARFTIFSNKEKLQKEKPPTHLITTSHIYHH